MFRTLRVIDGAPLHWPLHYQKLLYDCAAIGIDCPELGLLTGELEGLLENHPDSVVKIIVTRGEGARGYAPPSVTEPTYIWDVSPLPDYPVDWRKYGIKAILCQLRLSNQPRLAGIKHLNRLENVLAANEWDDADIAEGLMMDTAGNVIEATRSNLFMVVQGQLITPELSRCGVAGVQRDRVINWANQHDVPVQVRDVSLTEVLLADELFIVNSIIGVWPLRELENRQWIDFPFTKNICLDMEGVE